MSNPEASAATPGDHIPKTLPADTPSVCAKLEALDKVHGVKSVLLLQLDKALYIGRDPSQCGFVIQSKWISGVHCKVCVVASESGVIVSCEDRSTNGFLLNGQQIQRASVILMHGDIIELPSRKCFRCIHVCKQKKEKSTFFDPTPPTQPSNKKIGKYIVTSHCLGSGAFASVHLAMDTEFHCQVACKVIKAKGRRNCSQMLQEVSILQTLRHPNINRVLEHEHPGANDSFVTIFLELCTGGDLFTYIESYSKRYREMCEEEAKYIMYQLLRALKYLHDKEIAHRDIKPENILLYVPGHYPRIQLADFGLAREKSAKSTMNAVGTVSYLPPEGILVMDKKHPKYTGMPADCWSAGVVLYIMLSGVHPFEVQDHRWARDELFSSEDDDIADDQDGQSGMGNQNKEFARALCTQLREEAKAKQLIVQGSPCFPSYRWSSMPHAQALVKSLMQYRWESRATAKMALKSEWIHNSIDDLRTFYMERTGSA